MRTLHLTLKAQWYNMIEQGIKKEEYREIKPYWKKRLCRSKGWCDFGGWCERFCCQNIHHDYDAVCFHYGYTSRTMTFKIEDISIGTGKREWGAEEGRKYFVIKLGDKIE